MLRLLLICRGLEVDLVLVTLGLVALINILLFYEKICHISHSTCMQLPCVIDVRRDFSC